ncbi:MAG: hypothetical protein LBT79_01695 [Elusimicrobiota bacterium]|jgi:hypothetical protein|nr:hypothetical protein [Elusimicrobiota bacterium]
MKSKLLNLYRGVDKTEFFATITIPPERVNELSQLRDKNIQIAIKKWSEKRTLDANAALWVLINEMAVKLNMGIQDLYLKMLQDYGVFEFVCVKRQAVERLKQIYRLCKEISEVEINGKPAVQYQCFIGSSSYNREEFTRLLDGVIEEARQLDIYLITKEERDLVLGRIK